MNVIMMSTIIRSVAVPKVKSFIVVSMSILSKMPMHGPS